MQFGTAFQEMDALSGRSQTTQGIWLARAPKIEEPLTLVLDLEGSDGHERGEDDSSFERQSSLFALAVADVLLVNMWAKDVGREAGASKPLLKTIFQAGPAEVCGRVRVGRSLHAQHIMECSVEQPRLRPCAHAKGIAQVGGLQGSALTVLSGWPCALLT